METPSATMGGWDEQSVTAHVADAKVHAVPSSMGASERRRKGGGKASKSPAQQPDVTPQAERNAQRRSPRSDREQKRKARDQGDEQSGKRRPEGRLHIPQGLTGGQQRAGEGIGGQSGGVGTQGKRSGVHGFGIEGSMSENERDQRNRHGRQACRSREIQTQRKVLGPGCFRNEG